MKKSILTNNKAFSLLEVTVVIIILTILASAAIPVLSRSYIEKAGNKTALDISGIQEAARAYYVDHNKWPDSSVYPTPIAALQAGNYLPARWNVINPFGVSSGNPSSYRYNVSSIGSTLTVDTFVPTVAQTIIENLLPASGVLPNNNIFSSISVPGVSSVMPTGSIMPWASNNLPAGFLWCNGQIVSITSYPGLYAVLGTMYGGDGISTFGLPDLMGRAVVGVDGMGGATVTNRITQWGTLPATVGGSFGEDKHHLTIPELPAHNFYIMINDATTSGGSVRYPETVSVTSLKPYYSNTVGQDQPHNVVQPSIALGYIIKY